MLQFNKWVFALIFDGASLLTLFVDHLANSFKGRAHKAESIPPIGLKAHHRVLEVQLVSLYLLGGPVGRNHSLELVPDLLPVGEGVVEVI